MEVLREMFKVIGERIQNSFNVAKAAWDKAVELEKRIEKLEQDLPSTPPVKEISDNECSDN